MSSGSNGKKYRFRKNLVFQIVYFVAIDIVHLYHTISERASKKLILFQLKLNYIITLVV